MAAEPPPLDIRQLITDQEALLKATDLSDGNLHRLESDIQDPEKRLKALLSLVRFANAKLFRVGSIITFDTSDPKRNAREETAAALAARYGDAETVSRALDSATPELQLWGLWFWNQGCFHALIKAGRNPLVLSPTNRTKDEELWFHLEPKVRKLAKDSSHRHLAVEYLARYAWEENRMFLQSLIPTENDPEQLLLLIDSTVIKHGSDIYTERDRLYCQELLKRMNDPDPTIRTQALGAIGWADSNGNLDYWGSKSIVRFSPEIAKRVNELLQSKNAAEVEAAKWAAECLPKIEAWCNSHGR